MPDRTEITLAPGDCTTVEIQADFGGDPTPDSFTDYLTVLIAPDGASTLVSPTTPAIGFPFGDYLVNVTVTPGASPSMFAVEYCETSGLTTAGIRKTPPFTVGEVFFTFDGPDPAHGGPFPFLIGPPDLVITKTTDDTPEAGGLLRYAIRVDNVGTGTADEAEISDTVPLGTTFVGFEVPAGSDSSWSCNDGALAGTKCTVSTDHHSKTDGVSNISRSGLRPGEFVLIDFVVRVDDPAPGTITNEASVEVPPGDPTPENNSVQHTSTTPEVPPDDDEGDIRDTGNWTAGPGWSFSTGGTAPPSIVPCDPPADGGAIWTCGGVTVTSGGSDCIDIFPGPDDPSLGCGGTPTDDPQCEPDPSGPDDGCIPCELGTLPEDSDGDGVDDGCTPCPPGTFGPGDPPSCLPCELGTAPGDSGGNGSDSCVECPKGTYSSALLGDVVCAPPGAGSVLGEVIVAETTTLERRGNPRVAQDGSQLLADPLFMTRNLGPLNADPAGLQWYRLEADGWVALPTSVDYVAWSISFIADTTGRYVLFVVAVRDIPLPAGTAALGFHGAPGTPPDLLQGQLEDPGALDAIFQFRSGAWLSFRPGGLALLNSLTSIDANAPLFLVLSRATRWAGPINPSGDRDIPIASGFTSFTYTSGGGLPPAALIALFDSPGVVTVIFAFDNALNDDRGGYRTFRTTGPDFLNDLEALAMFDVLFVLADTATSLSLPGG